MLNLPAFLPALERTQINALYASSQPFLRITGFNRCDWRRNAHDKRAGPWRYEAVYEVLDHSVWKSSGEVLYFLVDADQRLKLVGESGTRLGQRWRISPMHRVEDNAFLGKRGLFHSSAFAMLQTAFESGQTPLYTVSAIFRPQIDRLAHELGGPLYRATLSPEKPNKVAKNVERWICQLLGRDHLWNIADTPAGAPDMESENRVRF